MYLPHTWGAEGNLEEYDKTLKDIDYQISGIIAGMDAQVEVQPRQGPFVGESTRISRGNTMREKVQRGDAG